MPNDECRMTNVVDRLIELARRQAQEAEVHLEESESRPVQFENNELKYVHTKSQRAVSLRVIRDGRIGFASTTDLSQPEPLVARAIESSRFGQEARFGLPPAAPCPQVAVYDPKVADFPVERGIELGREAIGRVLAEFPDVLCGVEVSTWVGRSRLANTSGLDVRHEATGFDSYLSALRVRDGGLLWVGDGESSRALVANFGRYAAKVISDIRRAETECDAPTGECPVLFTAKAVDLLVSLFQTLVNGKIVQKGASPLGGRLGERVLDERITLCDDGTRDYGDGSSSCDGEGVPCRRTGVFERGVLRSFLFDLQTAGLVGAETTGNAVRGFAGLPHPDATNLVIDAGTDRYEDLLAGIERGLLVDDVLGGGQSNVLAGEFSVNVGLGFLVERGQIVGRVKDCMIAGNVLEIFNRIRGVGNRQETHGSMVTPPICFDAIAVAGGD